MHPESGGPAADDGQSSSTMDPITTCDACRTRKVKCNPLQGDELHEARREGCGSKCRSCYRREEDCEYEYTYKKSGRPRGSTKRQRDSVDRRTSSSTAHNGSNGPVSPQPLYGHAGQSGWSPPFNETLSTSGYSALVSGRNAQHAQPAYGPATGTIFGSALSALSSEEQTHLEDLFAFGSRSSPALLHVQLASRDPERDNSGLLFNNALNSQGQSSMPISPPIRVGGSGGSSSQPLKHPPAELSQHDPLPAPPAPAGIPPIENVAPWQDICFFLSLHMRHQHGLMPLVHKPTFAQDVLQRRDQGDEVFRGLLCSIVAYTICQCPISIMTPKYTRPDLETILRRCQRTSRAVQNKWQMTPSLESLASLQLDVNTSLAATQVDLATVLIAEVRRQVYTLGLNQVTPRENLTTIELELCRRLFWEVYQSDRTNVMNAIAPISLNELEGIPPHPLEVDDDFITNSSAVPQQPPNVVSYMTGFNVVSRLFQILGQCQIRQKTYACNRLAGPPVPVLLGWISDQQLELQHLLGGLPAKLRADWRDRGGFEHAEESSLGIQRANIHITALCVELALLDFRAQLEPELDTKQHREFLARKAYDTLSNVPIEYLASNGESMRGKVLRIVLDLLSLSSGSDMFGKDVWDWWNMYSSVQFFQVIPEQISHKT